MMVLRLLGALKIASVVAVTGELVIFNVIETCWGFGKMRLYFVTSMLFSTVVMLILSAD
jgi:hypothetical protein